MPKIPPHKEPSRLLRAAAGAALFAGSAGSAALTIYMGRHNKSILLVACFVVWVLSPFAALAGADWCKKRWSRLARIPSDLLTVFLAPASVVIYAVTALGPPRPKPAFVFLVLPAASWLLIAVSTGIASWAARRWPGLPAATR